VRGKRASLGGGKKNEEEGSLFLGGGRKDKAEDASKVQNNCDHRWGETALKKKEVSGNKKQSEKRPEPKGRTKGRLAGLIGDRRGGGGGGLRKKKLSAKNV